MCVALPKSKVQQRINSKMKSNFSCGCPNFLWAFKTCHKVATLFKLGGVGVSSMNALLFDDLENNSWSEHDRNHFFTLWYGLRKTTSASQQPIKHWFSVLRHRPLRNRRTNLVHPFSQRPQLLSPSPKFNFWYRPLRSEKRPCYIVLIFVNRCQ